MSFEYEEHDGLRFIPKTDAERDVITNPLNGLTIFNSSTKQLETYLNGAWLGSKFHPVDFDAVVDNSYTGYAPGVYTKLEDAVNAGHTSILVRDMSADGPITVGSSSVMQRLSGIDADTTDVSDVISISKEAVMVERLRISQDRLTMSGSHYTLSNLLVEGNGQLELKARGLVTEIRSTNFSRTPIVLDSDTALTIRSARIIPSQTVTAARFIELKSSSIVDRTAEIDDVLISGQATGYSIQSTGGYFYYDLRLTRLSMEGQHAGAIDVVGGRVGHVIIGFSIFRGNTGTTPLIKLQGSGGTRTPLLFIGNTVNGTGRLFEFTGGDSEAPGQRFIGNTWYGSTAVVRVPPYSYWSDNYFDSSVTIDFQSKPGIVIYGGDMTGCTLSNIPADIVIRNVRGQEDRGHPTVKAKRTSDQTMTTATWTSVNFTTEDWDTDAMHDNSTNNNRLTAKVAGKYRAVANISWAAHATGSRYTSIRDSAGNILGLSIVVAGGAGSGIAQSVTADVSLAANDWVEVQVYQDSGGNLAVTTGFGVPVNFSMSKIS